MTPEIQKMLAANEQPDNIIRLRDKLNSLLLTSRNAMAKHYKKWNRTMQTFKGERITDEEDLEARDVNEPEKFVVPLTYAQVQTFVTFGFLLLTQNARFFEFSPTGNEDFDIRELAEKGLQRDLNKNAWSSKLYQFLLDLARFSIAPGKLWWTVDTMKVNVTTPGSVLDTPFGQIEIPSEEVEVDAIKYEGNRILNISPYRWLPDTRKPLVQWQQGQFVADDDEWHIENVKMLETKGLAAGTEFLERFSKTSFESIHGKGSNLKLVEKSCDCKDENDFMCALTEGQYLLTPSEYDLGKGKEPELWTFRICNGRIISLEKSGNLHGEFNYFCGFFSADQEAQISESLSDVIAAIQETITWLINTRLTSVRKSLDVKTVYNPMFVKSADLESRSPIIALKPNTPPGTSIDSLVQQLEIRDTTTGHFQDADTLIKIMQMITGVNENAMGQFSGGRRSATEARAANAGASSRMKVVLTCAWADALGPLGYKMMLNQRQAMSFETFAKLFGQDPTTLALYERFVPASPTDLIGNEDFFTFDSTLTSEKGFLAQSLQELFIAMVNNPELAQMEGFDFSKCFDEIQTLRGVTNVSRFFNKPPAMDPGLLAQQTGGVPTGTGAVGAPGAEGAAQVDGGGSGV